MISHSVPVFSSEDSTGTVRIAGEYPDYYRCWLIMDRNIFYVDSSSPQNGFTDLQVSRPINAFSVMIPYDTSVAYEEFTGNAFEADVVYYEKDNYDYYYKTEDESYDSSKTYYIEKAWVEAYIAAKIREQFQNGSTTHGDSEYSMPYLTVNYSGNTYVDVTYENNEFYDLVELMDIAVEKGVEFSFVTDYDKLTLNIYSRDEETHHVIFGDGHNLLTDVTLSSNLVSKVTVYRRDEDNNLTEGETWYWHKDGSISQTPPEPRIKGSWEKVSVTDEDVTDQEAAEEMMEDNDGSVKLTFMSDSEFEYLDKVTCRINEEVITEYITSCFISDSTPLRQYTLGSLPTTLTDQIRKDRKQESRRNSVTYEGSEDEYVNANGGTVNGSLNIQNSMSANTVIVGDDSVGTSLPSTGQDGQVFYLI